MRWIPNVPKEVEQRIEKENASIQRAMWESKYENIRRKREPRKFVEPIIVETSESESEN